VAKAKMRSSDRQDTLAGHPGHKDASEIDFRQLRQSERNLLSLYSSARRFVEAEPAGHLANETESRTTQQNEV
jgi:hypothetical protein